jgi:exonuclease SbcD
MPFIKPAVVRGMFGAKEIESYDDAVAAAVAAADIDYTTRNVLVSHQFYTKAGVTSIRSESEMNPVGGLDAVSADIIEKFDYVALGHLHGRQGVGSEHVRYCGSPIKYSFSEWRQEKAVTLVELGEKCDLSIKALPLTPLHDMREIKGEIDKLMSDEISSLVDKEDYLRVILTDEDEIIDPLGKLRSVYPNIMSLDFDNTRTNIDISVISADVEAIEKLSPYELFSEFFLEVQGSTMSDEQAVIVRNLLERSDEE